MKLARDKPDCALRLLGEAGGIELEYPIRLVDPPNSLAYAPFVMWLVATLKPRMIVELGVHSGNSYCAFLQAVKGLGLSTTCFGVDHWQDDADVDYNGEDVYHEFRAYHDLRYGTFSTLLRTPFQEALPYFSDQSIDIVHIDGFHTYD